MQLFDQLRDIACCSQISDRCETAFHLPVAASISRPLAPVRSATASDVAVSGVPQSTMLRRSLSCDVAASLTTAFTRAAPTTGSVSPDSNQDGRLLPAAALDFEAGDDPLRPERGARNAAGYDHRCKVDGTLRKAIGAGRYQELGKCLGDGHDGSKPSALGPGSASGTPGSAEEVGC